MRRKRIVLVGCLAAVVALGGFLWRTRRSDPADLARRAREALSRGDTELARRLAEGALERAPDSAEVLVTAGAVSASAGDVPRALELYGRVPHDGSDAEIVGAGAAGDLFVKLFRLSDAERCFRRVLDIRPDHVQANRRLAALLIISGRRRESARYLLKLARLDECDPDELALLGNLEQVFDNREVIDRFCEGAPNDPVPRLGAAGVAVMYNELSRATEMLETLVHRAPQLWEARVNLGKLLVSFGSDAQFQDWHDALPPDLEENPDIWSIRARFAERKGDPEGALRCCWEALRRDANLWEANYRLSVLLAARHDERAELFIERARYLKVLMDVLKDILVDGMTGELALKAGQTAEQLGRLWEASNWYRLALSVEPQLEGALDGRVRVDRLLVDDLPQVAPSSNPALAVDLSASPVPDWVRSGARRSRESALPVAEVSIEFSDLAAEAGVHFTYDNGDDRDEPGTLIWQGLGGGVAALDFDGDAWPDLYFTQGGPMPPRSGSPQPIDRLFRNRGDGTFRDVTLPAGLGDEDFSQGVAAGDFDGDGFADLYVANIGRNRLNRNNGDGTFADVTQASRITTGGWTGSCLIGDLNGDGLADLYDATYLAGREPLHRVCVDRQLHEPRTCPPMEFDAQEDRLQLNLGDGTFADVTAAAGIVAPEGKGLGVVAADFEETGRPNLFVANDMAANFYFINETPGSPLKKGTVPAGHTDGSGENQSSERDSPLFQQAAVPGAAPRFRESALVAGCAYSAAGRSNANMGIAVADCDGDGRLDLFLTAFHRQYSLLFLQESPGLFSDRSGEAGLKEISAHVLGFGTQFLDADLDGWPDLVVANGHIDDFRKKGEPFRMRAHFYHNEGQARFAQISGESLGGYFTRELLGRGLARLDWDRDGREDFAVSHLDTPAALVTNRTSATGHFLALQLHGITSNRDAVGAIVRVTAGGRTRMQQVTAGDGYFASNQKQLIFGLAEAESVDEIFIRWPSGREQHFAGVATDGEFIALEGAPRLHRMPAH